MSYVSKVNLNGTEYDIKDTEGRSLTAAAETNIASLAASTNGCMYYFTGNSIQSVAGTFWFDYKSGIDVSELPTLEDQTWTNTDWYGVQIGATGGVDKVQYIWQAHHEFKRFDDNALGSEAWTADSWYCCGFKSANLNIGSGTNPVYLSNRILLASESNVGANNRPVYMNGGTITQCVTNGMTAIGYGAVANASNATAYGNGAVATGIRAVAIGYSASAMANNAIAVGYSAAVSESSSAIAIGYNAAVGSNCYQSVTIGPNSAVDNYQAVAIGFNAAVNGIQGIAIGYNAAASGDGAAGLGIRANATADNSTAIGYNAACANSWGMQLGNASSLSSLTCKVSLTVTSDIRDKTDIEELPDGATEFLKAVTAIRYVFNGRELYIPDEEDRTDEDKANLAAYGMCAYDTEAWEAGTKKGARKRVGISAQGIQAALEEVYGDSGYINLVNDNLYDFDPDTIPDDVESRLAVNYEGFVPVIVKAFQELEARVAALEEAAG